MNRLRPSRMVCERCNLPLQRNRSGWRHAVNKNTAPLSCGLPPIAVRFVDQPLPAGTQMLIWHPAGTVTVEHRRYRQKFSTGSFDHLVGTVWPIRRSGRVVGTGVVVSARVPADGSGVTIAVEITSGEEQAA